MAYPLLITPPNITSLLNGHSIRSAFDSDIPLQWEKRNCVRFMNWFNSIRQQRLEVLCSLLQDSLAGSSVELLTRFSMKAAHILLHDPDLSCEFHLPAETVRVVSDQGHCLALDMAILVAAQLEQFYASAYWTIYRKGSKRDISYNHPLLIWGDDPGQTFDVFEEGINPAYRILNGACEVDAWAEQYKAITEAY